MEGLPIDGQKWRKMARYYEQFSRQGVAAPSGDDVRRRDDRH